MTQFKLICFDFDGVLFVDKDIHYEALNFAIEVVLGRDYIISKKALLFNITIVIMQGTYTR